MGGELAGFGEVDGGVAAVAGLGLRPAAVGDGSDRRADGDVDVDGRGGFARAEGGDPGGPALWTGTVSPAAPETVEAVSR